MPLSAWRYEGDGRITFAFAGEFDIQFSVRAAGPCHVEIKGQRYSPRAENGLWFFTLPMKQVSDAQLLCQ